LIGLPGSGKSHFQRDLQRRTGAVALESDVWRKRLFSHPVYSREESGVVFYRIRSAASRLLATRQSVIVDATNLSERERQPYYRLAGKHGAKLQLVHLVAPERVTRERLSARQAKVESLDNSDAGMDVYERMRGDFQAIRRPHLVVDTSLDISPAVEAVAKAMESS